MNINRFGLIGGVALFLVLSFSPLLSQTSSHPGQLDYSIQTTPGAIPTSLTTVYAGDAYVCEADFTATGQNILVQDRQSTPVAWINNILGASMSPNTWYWQASNDGNCRHFPNGVSWQAGGAGVTGYIIIKHN